MTLLTARRKMVAFGIAMTVAGLLAGCGGSSISKTSTPTKGIVIPKDDGIKK